MFDRLLSLVLYTACGLVCCAMMNLPTLKSIGVSLMFGMIMGVLNEIHRDLYFMNHKNNE